MTLLTLNIRPEQGLMNSVKWRTEAKAGETRTATRPHMSLHSVIINCCTFCGDQLQSEMKQFKILSCTQLLSRFPRKAVLVGILLNN